jgi:hypothetical protein
MKPVIERYFEPLQAVFETRLEALRTKCEARKQMTQYYVAVLWLRCAARNNEIAKAIDTTVPNVIQHRTRIREHIVNMDSPVFDDISKESGFPVKTVKGVLSGGVEHFVRPDLLRELTKMFRDLNESQPLVFEIGFHVFVENRSEDQIVGRPRIAFDESELDSQTMQTKGGESESVQPPRWTREEVRRTTDEFEAWKNSMMNELAGKFHIPTKILKARISDLIKAEMRSG